MLTFTNQKREALPAKTSGPVQNIVVTEKSEGVSDLGSGRTMNIFPLPDTINETAYLKTETGAAAKTVYLFNQNKYQNITASGGATAIAYTFSDGYTGKVYENLFQSANNGQGVKIYGFNIQFTDESGNAVPSAITTAAFKFLTQDGNGSTIPVAVNLSQAQRNTAYDQGLLTVKYEGYFNCLQQISLYLPVGVTAAVAIMLTPTGVQ